MSCFAISLSPPSFRMLVILSTAVRFSRFFILPTKFLHFFIFVMCVPWKNFVPKKVIHKHYHDYRVIPGISFCLISHKILVFNWLNQEILYNNHPDFPGWSPITRDERKIQVTSKSTKPLGIISLLVWISLHCTYKWISGSNLFKIEKAD